MNDILGIEAPNNAWLVLIFALVTNALYALLHYIVPRSWQEFRLGSNELQRRLAAKRVKEVNSYSSLTEMVAFQNRWYLRGIGAGCVAAFHLAVLLQLNLKVSIHEEAATIVAVNEHTAIEAVVAILMSLGFGLSTIRCFYCSIRAVEFSKLVDGVKNGSYKIERA